MHFISLKKTTQYILDIGIILGISENITLGFSPGLSKVGWGLEYPTPHILSNLLTFNFSL